MALGRFSINLGGGSEGFGLMDIIQGMFGLDDPAGIAQARLNDPDNPYVIPRVAPPVAPPVAPAAQEGLFDYINFDIGGTEPLSSVEVEPFDDTPRVSTASGLLGEWTIDVNTGATDLSFEDWLESRRESWADWAGISAATAYQEAMVQIQIALDRIAAEQSSRRRSRRN